MFLQRRLQGLIANILFPSGQKDWYSSKGYGTEDQTAFEDFVAQQRDEGGKNARYYEAFQNLSFEQTHIKSQLSSGDDCKLEVCTITNEPASGESVEALPGKGKHIIYFPGADTYYQACFRDMTAAAKETGATVHAFNFPGTGSSTGKVLEARDLINSGISVVNDLLRKNPELSVDDIVLQGDCYGAAIAYEVKKQFEDQSNLRMRIVVNNAFESFEAAILDMIPSFLSFLSPLISKILKWTGWDIRPSNMYEGICPDQIHIQHEGDQTLINSKLADNVDKQMEDWDPCPIAFREDRDALSDKLYVKVKPECEERLKKFGTKNGKINAHFADLCETEVATTGESVYKGLINDFIKRSDAYYEKSGITHDRLDSEGRDTYELPQLLGEVEKIEPSREEREEIGQAEAQLQQLADMRLEDVLRNMASKEGELDIESYEPASMNPGVGG